MTPELRQARAGKMTASKAAVTMGGLDTSGLKSYIMDIAWERVYGVSDDEGFQTPAMARGVELEALARDWYAFTRDCIVDHDPDRTIDHPTIAMVAASPDGLLPDRVIETKCPLHKAWMEVKKSSLVPSEYRWQCRWQMWVTGLELCDFVCWHPVAGGLIVPFSVTKAECDEMAARAALIEKKIAEWVEIIGERNALLTAKAIGRSPDRLAAITP